MYNLIGFRKYAYWFSGFLMALSIAALAGWGLPLGLDFKGGTLMEVNFTTEKLPATEDVQAKLSELNLQSLSLQPTGEPARTATQSVAGGKGLIIRYLASDENANQVVLEKLKEFDSGVVQERVDFIGASVSSQIKQNAFHAVLVAMVVIALYIAYAFRKVSHPVSSWQYGIQAVVALVHDVIVTLGIFAVIGHFFQVEINAAFIAAILTILGFSVHDTIVVYDRTRENLIRSRSNEDFESIVNRSLNETLARSFNTSFTVLFVLAALLVYGGESIRSFVLALFIGIASGVYSSFYVASALLVTSYKWKKAKN